MREVTLRIRHRGEPESDVSVDYPNVTIRSVSSLTGGGQERKRIVELRGPEGEVEAFLESFEKSDPVLDVERYSPLSADRVLVGVTYDSYTWDSIAQRVSDFGVHYRVGTIIKAGWEHWTFYLDEGDDLQALVDSLEAAGNDVELARDVSLDALDGHEHFALSKIADELTDRQREVLATAIEMGYYEQGNTTSIEDVGAELGLASTTTWEHLSRAEKKVMEELGEYLTSRGH